MRMPPLLADFSHARPCKPFCENSLTLPIITRLPRNFIHGNRFAPRLLIISSLGVSFSPSHNMCFSKNSLDFHRDFRYGMLAKRTGRSAAAMNKHDSLMPEVSRTTPKKRHRRTVISGDHSQPPRMFPAPTAILSSRHCGYEAHSGTCRCGLRCPFTSGTISL